VNRRNAANAANRCWTDIRWNWTTPPSMPPAFEQASRQLAGKALLVKVNSDDSPQLSQRFGIRSIPTLVRLQQGQETARQSGAIPASAIVALAGA
jgi:thioredoxin 2